MGEVYLSQWSNFLRPCLLRISLEGRRYYWHTHVFKKVAVVCGCFYFLNVFLRLKLLFPECRRFTKVMGQSLFCSPDILCVVLLACGLFSVLSVDFVCRFDLTVLGAGYLRKYAEAQPAAASSARGQTANSK